MSIVMKAAARSTASNPLYSAVLFEAAGGALRISATDAEISLSLRCAAKAEREGTLAVGARVLNDLVRSLDGGEITLQERDGQARLSYGEGEYALRLYAAEDFPKIPEFPAEGSFSVSAGALAQAAKKVLPSVSKDETRPILTGALVSFSDGKVVLASTDSFRLGIVEAALEGAPDLGREAIIPARALRELSSLATRLDEVRIAMTENSALFRGPGLLLASRLIDGSFPEYRRLLPAEFAAEFTVPAGPLVETLGRVNLFAGSGRDGKNANPVRLEFKKGNGTLEGGTLEVSAEGAQTGAARESIGVEVKEGLRATFNGDYLLDGVRTCGSEEVRIRFTEPLKPAVIEPSEADGYRCIIMPMRDPSEGR